MPSDHDFPRRLIAVLKLVAGAVAAAYIIIFAVTAILRITYPFELEWMEGAMVDHVARIMHGLPLYVEPSVDFVPFRYTPLYYYVSAAVSGITGFSLFSLRLVSVVSAIGAFVLLFLFVRRETGRNLPGLLAAALFAAAYPITGSFYDLARIDSLFMVLLLAAAYAFRFYPSMRGAILSGLLFGLAFLTKQAAGPVLALLLIPALFLNWRYTLVCGFSALVVAGGASLALTLASDGWYWFYTIELGDNIFPTESFVASIRKVFVEDLLRSFPIAAPLALAALVDITLREDRRTRWFHLSFAVGLIAIIFIARIHPGGWTNTLIPACAAIALLFGLAVGRLDLAADTFRAGVRQSALVSLYLLVIVQLAMLAYDPRKHLPSDADRAAGQRFIAQIESIDGDVYVPHHGYYAMLAGKKTFAHFQAIRDVWSSPEHSAITRGMTGTIRDAITGRRFAAMVLDRDFFIEEVRANYTESGKIFDRGEVFFPRAGWAVRPERLYLPK